MAVIFRDDFDGASFTPLDGRVVEGLAWSVPSGYIELNGAGQISSTGGRGVLTIPAAQFAGAAWVELEFGFEVGYGLVEGRICPPANAAASNPGNPGCSAAVEAGSNITVKAADNSGSFLPFEVPTSGVLRIRLTVGEPSVPLHVDGVLVGVVNTAGDVPMDAPGDVAVAVIFSYGGPLLDYVEVRAEAAAPPSGDGFWTDFVNTYEIP